MLHGLDASIAMLHEEGLDNVFARHDRLAEATRRAVRAWGLEIMCRDPKYYSPTITGVMMPEGHDGDAFRNLALETFNISYGASFGRYTGKYFRIGHLGDINDGYLIGALAATEMALSLAGVPHKKRRAGGVDLSSRVQPGAGGAASKVLVLFFHVLESPSPARGVASEWGSANPQAPPDSLARRLPFSGEG